jgi:hypothetical protein
MPQNPAGQVHIVLSVIRYFALQAARQYLCATG